MSLLRLRKHVVVAGPHFVGSTRLFNLVRYIYEQKGYNVTAMWHQDKHVLPKGDVLVEKAHDLSECDTLKGSTVVLMPVRDARDCIVTKIKRGGPRSWAVNEGSKEHKRCYEATVDRCNLVYKYETHSVQQIIRLADELGESLTKEEARKLSDKLDALHASKTPAADTLYTPQHNTSGGASNKFKTELTTREQEQINSVLQDYQKRYGYIQ
jgi:hypothetical protein